MAQGSYPFIDIAVLDAVRDRFLAGDAIVVLDRALDEIVWANGAGAALFGHDDVEAARGATAELGIAGRRQIASTPGFPAIGPGRSLLVRLPQGLASRAIGFVASQIRLPDGAIGIMLAAPDLDGEKRSAAQAGERMLYGIAREGQHTALIDGEGAILAQSAHFADAAISQETLQGLAGGVTKEADRLAKRMVRANGRTYPAGIALLSDNPVRALVIVVEDAVESDNAPAPTFGQRPAKTTEDLRPARREPTPDNWQFSDRRKPATAKPEPVKPEPVESTIVETEDDEIVAFGHPDGIVADDFEFSDTFEVEEAIGDTLNEEAVSDGADDDSSDADGPDTEAAEGASTQARDTGIATADDGDGPQFKPDLKAAPVRFVWKTDPEGRINSLSPEFAASVGPKAADVIGQRFADVAKRFDLDPDGEIAGLLERRDTWSGRAVLWPVAGTDLKVPVDLAALPVYGRERNFEGFRGFGVARMADAVVDEQAIGLSLVDGVVPMTTEAAQADEAAAADPFKGETAALNVETTPERRSSDKVIRLAERRQPTPERSLSPVETNAFREIAERLRDSNRDTSSKGAGESADQAPVAETEAVEQQQMVQDNHGGDAARQQHENGFDVEAQDGEDEVAPPEGWDDAERPFADKADGEIAYPRATMRDETPADEEPEVGPEPDQVSLLEKLPVPVLVHAGDVLHFANEEFLKLTGYGSLEELQAAGGIEALFSEGDADDDHRRRLRTRDGTEFPVEALLQSVPWGKGKALMLAIKATRAEPAAPPPVQPVIGDGEDVDVRLAEMRAILDTATDGIIIINNEGAVRSVSRPAEALFGFDAFELVGKPFVSLFALESQRAARDYLNGLSDNGVASVLNDGREVIGRESRGRFIPLFMTIGRLPGGNGYCAVLRDITQWKRAEEDLTKARAEAERSSNQKTEFLARISHEIRTPLNAIIGFSELMIDEKFGPIVNERYKDYLRDINRSGNHVLDLVNDLLDISKIEAGEQEMAHEAVSLNETLAEAVAMMQPQANRERVIIRSSFASRLPEVVADQRSIRQIALNLLSNAVRFTQAGGQVIVSTSYEVTGDIMVRVRDTGIGMSQSEIDQAMKPFKQIDALKRSRGDGTGLGLPLTKAMVEANRARFLIHSTPGEGTMVEITFPSTRVLAG